MKEKVYALEIVNVDRLDEDECILADDNPIYIIDKIKAGEITGKDLDTSQRRQTIRHLQSEGMRQAEIAVFMKIDRRHVSKDITRMQKKYSKDLLTSNAIDIVGRLAQQASMVKGMAHKKGDYLTMWRVEKEMFEKLQDMGFVPKIAIKVDIDGVRSTKEELTEGILRTIGNIDADDAAIRAEEAD